MKQAFQVFQLPSVSEMHIYKAISLIASDIAFTLIFFHSLIF